MSDDLKKCMQRAKKLYELKEVERLGLTPELEQRDKILSYITLLLKWNPAAGLISPKDEEVLFLRHFCDSLQPLLLFGFKKNASVLDIGSGGGFPSIPIMIFRPDLKFMLAESNRKKSSFLKEVVSELNLENVTVHSGRVQNLNVGDDKFDYVISRGLSTMQKFSQLAKPFISNDGRMYIFKTKSFETELQDITSNKEKDGVRVNEIAEYDLGSLIQGLNLVALELYN